MVVEKIILVEEAIVIQHRVVSILYQAPLAGGGREPEDTREEVDSE